MSTISVRKPPPVQHHEYMIPEETCCGTMNEWLNNAGNWVRSSIGGIVWDSQMGEIRISTHDDYDPIYRNRFKQAKISYCPFCGEKLEYVRES